MDLKKEFTKYAMSDFNMSSLAVDRHVSRIENSLTPYILEERELRVTQMDVFSRLLRDRIIWLSGPVDQHMCDIVQAQLMFLDSTQKQDITLHINSPGGSVLNGLGIVDMMNYVSSDIATVNTGMAASMGSVLLSAGTPGKRSALFYSKVMTHMVSSSYGGNIQDTTISHLESHKYNYILFKLLAENCGKTFEEMLESSRRDKWFNSKEALDFGLIDEVIGVDKDKKDINDYLEGFDDYYQKEVLSKKS
jgi:ATP-dependent Clp protease, protease subunit